MTDVEQIEAVLRSDLPEPSPAFAAELDRQVRDGFPKPPRRRPVWLRPALAGAAVLVGVAVVAISTFGGSDRHVAATFHGSVRFAAPDAALSTAAPLERKVQRDVQLTIVAPQDT